MAKRKTRSRREAAEESRSKLLQAGLELLAERLRSPIEHVRSTEVAERSGYTPGAFYHHWASQDAFRDDLRDMVGGQIEIDEALERLMTDFASGEDDAIAGLQAACRNEIATQSNNPSWHVQLAMLASNSQEDLDCSATQYQLWSDANSTFYGELLDALDLELRPGLTIEWFTAAITALSEGFSLQRRAGVPDVVLGDDWQPYEAAVGALVIGATLRRDGTPATATSFMDELRSLIA